MTTVTLPWPPSVNTYWRKWNGRMVLSDEGRNYRLCAAAEMIGVDHFDGRCSVEIAVFRPDDKIRDMDNMLKAPIDALVACGIIQGDSTRHLRRIAIDDMGIDRERPRLEVTITQ